MRNAERIVRTRGALIGAARKLFARQSFAETSTEAILSEAGVTRGALYHHFADKADLFAAVCKELSVEAAAVIERAVDGVADPLEALEKGSLAWLDFMLRADVRHILLVEAPTVLGWQRWQELDQAHSYRLLEAGVEAAFNAGQLQLSMGPRATGILLNGAMNALALHAGSLQGGLTPDEAANALQTLIASLSRR